MEQPPGNGIEVTSEQWAKMRADAEAWFESTKNINMQAISKSMMTVLGNLRSVLSPDHIDNVAMNERDTINMMYKFVTQAVDHMDRYMTLIETYPEFKAKEEASGPGYFEDLVVQNLPPEKLIPEYEKRLKGNG